MAQRGTWYLQFRDMMQDLLIQVSLLPLRILLRTISTVQYPFCWGAYRYKAELNEARFKYYFNGRWLRRVLSKLDRFVPGGVELYRRELDRI